MILTHFVNAMDYATRKEIYKGEALVQRFQVINEVTWLVGNIIQNVYGDAYLFTPFLVVKIDEELLKKLEETKVTDSNYYLPYLWGVFD